MPTTSPFNLPYPADSGAVDVAGDIEALAEAVDTALGSVGGSKAFPMMMGG